MLELLNSLSFESGSVVVALASAALAFIWAQVLNHMVRWVLGVVTPFVLAYSLYWSPVWLGADTSEFSSWAPIFIAPWFLAGTV
ncbi:MAG: hypothetical protein PHP05_09415, partial [Sideroxydans sp.]|nr:hypothetical protein [Sideroxydans sp.]